MEKSFEIVGIYFGNNRTFPDLNDLLHEYGRNPHCGNKMKQKFQNICNARVRYWLKGWHTEKPVVIHYEFGEADYKRDVSNVVSFGVKVIEDSLQVCKVIKNDSPKYLRNYTHEVRYVSKTEKPYIKVTIKEVN